jgi:predicted  nucleic acid-binding Zn-ribbon protein
MRDVIQNLVNLQYIDSKLDELRKMRGDLPEVILDTETDVVRLETRVNKNTAQYKDLELEKAKLELDIQDAQELIQKYEAQQMSVRNNREYDALTKELEAQKQLIENATSRLEEITILKQEIEEDQKVNKAQLEEKTAELKTLKVNLKELASKTEKEEDDLLEKRDEAKSLINQRYLRSYERLRTGLTNGLAVCAMHNGACMGMMMPPQVQMEVRRQNKLIIDENSGRIVVDQSFFDEAKRIFG